ncbi:MAG: thioesterase family protein [Proteobacteria bacterium]|nr:thioesterase family protein [Pseudomonadota bacterium]
MTDVQEQSRADFPHFTAIPTRWQDCDVYGHVNNVVYYAYFDTAVTEHLVREAGLRSTESPVIGVVVETKCQFRQELGFPEVIDAGIRVTRLGTSSATYAIGLFRQGNEKPAAFGHFVHVYIDRESRRPVPIPDQVRDALSKLAV